MAKNTEKKTGTKTEKRERKPFVQRLTKRLTATRVMLERIHKDDKHAKTVSPTLSALIPLIEAVGKLPADYTPPGSATSVRALNPGDVVTVNEDFAFMFPKLANGKTSKVKDVKKIGEGRGSKTAVLLENGDSGLAFQFNVV